MKMDLNGKNATSIKERKKERKEMNRFDFSTMQMNPFVTCSKLNFSLSRISNVQKLQLLQDSTSKKR